MLPTSASQLLTTVSRDALVLRDQSNYIFVVGKDDMAKRVNVDLGSGLGDRIAVYGELKAGDEVIIRGAERLRDGQQVERRGSRVSMR